MISLHQIRNRCQKDFTWKKKRKDSLQFIYHVKSGFKDYPHFFSCKFLLSFTCSIFGFYLKKFFISTSTGWKIWIWNLVENSGSVLPVKLPSKVTLIWFSINMNVTQTQNENTFYHQLLYHQHLHLIKLCSQLIKESIWNIMKEIKFSFRFSTSVFVYPS